MTKTPLEYAKSGCDALMSLYAPADLPPKDRLFYHQGVFLLGVQRYYKMTGDMKYFNYVKDYVDHFIGQDGSVPAGELQKLDGLQPSILFFDIFEKTQDSRYKKALSSLVSRLKEWKYTPDGGYWHTWYLPDQLWLDGLYMSGPLSLRYAAEFGDSSFYEKELLQVKLMKRYLLDEQTGLMFHAYDGRRTEPWADKDTGRSPEFWGRAIGWYLVALLDMLDYIPQDNAMFQEFQDDATALIKAIVRYQNPETGMWYQLINRTDDPNNWPEMSCTALFAYALAKAIRMGFIDESFLPYLEKAYNGIIKCICYDEQGLLTLENICVGTNVGEYEHYINRPRERRDLHGLGIFILMCLEVHQYKAGDQIPKFLIKHS